MANRTLKNLIVDLYVTAGEVQYFQNEDWTDYPLEFMRDAVVQLLQRSPGTQD